MRLKMTTTSRGGIGETEAETGMWWREEDVSTHTQITHITSKMLSVCVCV